MKSRGDTAVLEYTNKFDRLNASSVAGLEIKRDELQAALNSLHDLIGGVVDQRNLRPGHSQFQ